MILRLAACGGVLLVFCLAPAAARAQLACGSVIGPNQSFVLTGDVGPCDTGDAAFALKVVGPAKLDLAGHRVLCGDGDRPDGIRVEGSSAQLRGGAVIECDRGIALLAGTGSRGHRIENMVVRGSEGVGIASNSDSPRLSGNVVTGGDDHGFDLALGGTLMNNVAAENDGDGFVLGGLSGRVSGNIAAGNGGNGFVLESMGSGFTIQRNLSAANGGAGLLLLGDGSKLTANRLLSNQDSGILATSNGEGNAITRNVALGNAIDTPGEVDLRDELCVKTTPNTWSRNVSSTKEGACVN